MKTREEIITESMNAPKVIDRNVDMKLPFAPITQQYNPDKHKYKCSCCGKGFNTQKTYFLKSDSPLFQFNEGYLPWCKECTDRYVEKLTALYSGNEEHAIEHFCQQADWVFDIVPLKAARGNSSDRSRICQYAAKKNITYGGKKTYIDGLKFAYEEKQYEVIQSKDQVKSEDVSVSEAAIDRWGVGFNQIDYKILDDHYRMIKKNNPNCDSNQEIFIKSLCNIYMLMNRALRDGDSDRYVKLTDQYAKTFKNAGLKAVEEKDASNDETFCMTLGFISDYTPEEFYKNKGLYKDFDGIGEYIDRHITRPMKNLFEGTNIRDKEYFVPETDDVDEE